MIKTILDPKLWNFYIYSFAIIITSFAILSPILQCLYPLLQFISGTLGTNLDILEDKNYQIEDKYCQRGDKIAKDIYASKNSRKKNTYLE